VENALLVAETPGISGDSGAASGLYRTVADNSLLVVTYLLPEVRRREWHAVFAGQQMDFRSASG
jgi:hypothetical protein